MRPTRRIAVVRPFFVACCLVLVLAASRASSSRSSKDEERINDDPLDKGPATAPSTTSTTSTTSTSVKIDEDESSGDTRSNGGGKRRFGTRHNDTSKRIVGGFGEMDLASFKAFESEWARKNLKSEEYHHQPRGSKKKTLERTVDHVARIRPDSNKDKDDPVSVHGVDEDVIPLDRHGINVLNGNDRATSLLLRTRNKGVGRVEVPRGPKDEIPHERNHHRRFKSNGGRGGKNGARKKSRTDKEHDKTSEEQQQQQQQGKPSDGSKGDRRRASRPAKGKRFSNGGKTREKASRTRRDLYYSKERSDVFANSTDYYAQRKAVMDRFYARQREIANRYAKATIGAANNVTTTTTTSGMVYNDPNAEVASSTSRAQWFRYNAIPTSGYKKDETLDAKWKSNVTPKETTTTTPTTTTTTTTTTTPTTTSTTTTASPAVSYSWFNLDYNGRNNDTSSESKNIAQREDDSISLTNLNRNFDEWLNKNESKEDINRISNNTLNNFLQNLQEDYDNDDDHARNKLQASNDKNTAIEDQTWGVCKGKQVYQHNLLLGLKGPSDLETSFEVILNGPICITCVQAIRFNKTRARVDLESGGRSYGFAKLKLKGYKNEGFSYVIKIFGVRKVREDCKDVIS